MCRSVFVGDTSYESVLSNFSFICLSGEGLDDELVWKTGNFMQSGVRLGLES